MKHYNMKVQDIISEHKWKLSFTMTLILLESGIFILFPLFIGRAIDDAIAGGMNGGLQLGLLGLASLLVGAGRRFFDSRLYSSIFQKFGVRLISKIENANSSVKTARLGMLREVLEFMENSLPEIVGNIVSLVGVVLIVASLNQTVFYGSLIVTVLVLMIYGISSRRTIRLNRSFNDEFERQVDVIDKKDPRELSYHLKGIMKWNIKLSDLETVNFSLSWIVLMGFLVSAIVIAIGDGIVKYGALFSLIMYVFQYMESVLQLPLFYQNWLRLIEIKERLQAIE